MQLSLNSRIQKNKNLGPRQMKNIILFLLFITGCTSISTVKLSSKSYPAKSETCTIEVTTQKPDKKFKELLLLEINGSWRKNNLQELMPDIKKRACLAGGDAIIINSYKKDLIPSTTPDGGIDYSERAFVSVAVIRYLK